MGSVNLQYSDYIVYINESGDHSLETINLSFEMIVQICYVTQPEFMPLFSGIGITSKGKMMMPFRSNNDLKHKPEDFKWKYFSHEVILWAVRWYCQFALSYLLNSPVELLFF